MTGKELSKIEIGAIGQRMVEVQAMLRGIEVYLPVVDSGTDMILTYGTRTIRVQVKSRLSPKSKSWNCKRANNGGYSGCRIDYFIFPDIAKNCLYIVPSSEISPEQSAVQLSQIARYKNDWAGALLKNQQSEDKGTKRIDAAVRRAVECLRSMGMIPYVAKATCGHHILVEAAGRFVRLRLLSRSSLYNTRKSWQFSIRAPDGCDFFVCEQSESGNFFVVPSGGTENKNTICLSLSNSPYLNAWHLLTGGAKDGPRTNDH